jgi:hypothetical protein
MAERARRRANVRVAERDPNQEASSVLSEPWVRQSWLRECGGSDCGDAVRPMKVGRWTESFGIKMILVRETASRENERVEVVTDDFYLVCDRSTVSSG